MATSCSFCHDDDPETIYCRSCDALGIHPHTSLRNVLRPSLNPHLLVVLQLQRSYVGDAGVVCLARVLLPCFPALRALSLANNGVGNDGVVALCAALAEKCQPLRYGPVRHPTLPIAVLDLSDNLKITRVGGQALLHAVSRVHNHLSLVHLSNTRVSDYFESRITRLAQNHYDRLACAEQQEVYQLCRDIGLIEEQSRCPSSSFVPDATAAQPPPSVLSEVIRASTRHSSPQFLDDDTELIHDSGKATAMSPVGLPPRASSTGNSFDVLPVPPRVESVTNPMFQSNAPFDEVWYADGVAPNPPMRIHSVMDVVRPSAPSGLETILYSATPDFLHVFSPNEAISHAADSLSRRYTITTMPYRERTIYGFTTPSVDEVEIFSFVEQYKPKSIELPTKFMFPGSIDFVAAVHAPDPMLHPGVPQPQKRKKSLADRPAQVPVPAPPPVPHPFSSSASPSSAPPVPPIMQLPLAGAMIAENGFATPNAAAVVPPFAAAEEGQQRASMFWSFFHSAGASAGGGTGTPRERTPGAHTPRSHLPLASELSSFPSAPTAAPLSASAPIARSRDDASSHRQSAQSSTTATPTPSPVDSHLAAAAAAAAVAVTTPDEDTLAVVLSSPATRVSPLHSSPYASYAPLGGGTVTGSTMNAVSSGGNGSFGMTELSKRAAVRIDSLFLRLGKVNDACHSAVGMLSSRHASFPLPSEAAKANAAQYRSKPLSELLTDPEWAPGRPTRSSQIQDYCTLHKLKFDSVSRERRKTNQDSREYVLQNLIRPSITDNLSAGAMNTKGNLLVTSNYDMTCKVWDLETNKKLHTLRGHTGHLSDCAWNAPICDKVITSSFDKTLKVWDVLSGELLHTLRGHELEVVCVAVSADGLQCASGAMDDTAILWDIQTGAELFAFSGHSAEVIALDFSPVGGQLVSGSMDETVRLWSTVDGTCLRVFEGHSAEVGQIKFNCFGNIVLSGSIDGTCKLWDVKTGRHKTLRGHTHEVVDCDFAPDGWTCASASDDGTVRIWDVLSGGCLMLIVGHERGVCRLAYSANGKELITGSLDTTAKVWNVENGECKQTLRGHKGLVLVTYNAASEKILTLSRDNTCRIWQLEPELNTMHHAVAMAICSHPTLYNDIAYGTELPESMSKYLKHIYQKVFQADDHGLTAQTLRVRSPEFSGTDAPSETRDPDEEGPLPAQVQDAEQGALL